MERRDVERIAESARQELLRRAGTRDEYPPEQRGDVWLEGHSNGTAETVADVPEAELVEAPSPSRRWPAPLRREAFGGLAGEIVRAIEPETEADEAAILVQFLVAFGNLCGRHAYRAVGPRRHYPNLFACLIGGTSLARKGTAWSWVDTLLAEVDPAWHRDCALGGLSSGEGLIAALHDESERDRRLLAIEEEFSAVLKAAARDGSILSAIMRQGWDGGRLRVLTRKNPLLASNVHLSVIGHVTPPELAKLLTETDLANGFANRFLWACCRRSKSLPDGGAMLNLSPFVGQLQQAAFFAGQESRLDRDWPARQRWHREYERLTADVPGVLGLVTSRAAAQVLRLSVLYAVLDRSNVIALPHLESALAVWDYCRDSAAFVFGESTGDKDADELLDALRRSPAGLTLTEMSAVFDRHKSALQIQRMLDRLTEQGWVLPGRRGGNGRQAERWRVANPANPANPT